jgi:kumamolisin
MQRYSLQGSERRELRGAVLVGPADPAERLEVTLVLRRGGTDDLKTNITALRAKPLSRDEFATQYGARDTDITAVKNFAKAHHLTVVSADSARRSVVLSGSVTDFNAAFGVALQQYDHPGGSYRGRTGTLNLPDDLQDVVQAVLGLDNRPQAQAHFRRTRPDAADNGGAPTSYTPLQVAALYGFPAGDGAGQSIGIIELGGGYRPADLKTYFSGLGLTAPKITAVSVDHGRNHATGQPDGPDGEVMLDIEVAGAIAPKAKFAVYFAPNTDAGFLDAITTAIHDKTNAPGIISISWGGPESSWTQQALTAFDQAFQDAAALGITVCIASGDDGSNDGVGDGANHVNFPASSPHVLACGGTRLQAAGSSISAETVWNDGANGGASGGGVSAFFPLPDWQNGLKATKTGGGSEALTNRGVPDVSGDADPESGYNVRVDGSNTVVGGTSAVAPLWAGLIARLNAKRGTSLGFVNPLLYKTSSAFRDITEGNNGAFQASPGWDACTGLGSPNGPELAKL